jgi:ubiquinone/menaquinone biosynthesis C-methylase UbiE
VKGHRWYAATYDFVNQWGEARMLRPLRQRIVTGASGQVLEIGAGTGACFPYYRAAERVIATEPDPFMLPRARKRARELRLEVELVQSAAEALPFADASFDTAVCALVLCTVVDPARALAEIKRVLKPAGTLRFIEHVRFDGPRGQIQDAIVPVWSCVGAGCHPNRRTAEAIAAAGFAIVELERQDTPLVPIISGVAAAPTSP